MTTGSIGLLSLTDRATILLDELRMAIEWDRPCILFAVYRSEIVRDQLQSTIRQALQGMGNDILPFKVSKLHFDVALELRTQTGKQRNVFFISGLRWGGGRGRTKAFHALNMHREYLVEERIRSVFWLTALEARLLPRHAPDFWAFRYNVIEFLDFPPAPGGKDRSTSSEADQQSLEGIQTRLSKDPHNIALLRKLAGSYADLGFLEEALATSYRILRKLPGEEETWLAIADLYRRMEYPDQRARILRKLQASRRLHPARLAGERSTG